MLPTLTASDWKGPSGAPVISQAGHGLAAGGGVLLPTPTASRSTSNRGGAAGRSGPERLTLDGMAARDTWPTPMAGGNRKLPEAVLFPTPRASDSTRGSGESTAREGGPSLASAVAMWPTPTAGDAKSSGSRNKPGSKAHAGVSLTDAVLVGDSTTGHQRGQPGRLNPTWVESYLMGWPIGWTDCEPLETARFREWQQQHSSCCDTEPGGDGV